MHGCFQGSRGACDTRVPWHLLVAVCLLCTLVPGCLPEADSAAWLTRYPGTPACEWRARPEPTTWVLLAGARCNTLGTQ